MLNVNLDLTVIVQDFITKYGYVSGLFYILGIFTIILIQLYFFKNPGKFESLLAHIFYFLRWCGLKFKKRYIKYDIEGAVNNFVSGIGGLLYGYTPVGIRIKFIGPNDCEESFFDANALVVVMRDIGRQDDNIVRATMVSISKTVLPKTKRYLSKLQAESVDLYIAKKLFEKNKPQIEDYFYREFFDKQITEKSKIAEFVEKYNILDKANLFFPVFIQELNFLGEKVFYNKKDAQLMAEVSNLVDFLKNCAQRVVGTTNTPLTYEGRYCRCAIVIIGLSANIDRGKIKIYTNYINKLLAKKIETIYIVSPQKPENIELVDLVVKKIYDLQEYFRSDYRALVHTSEGTEMRGIHLVVLRTNQITRYIDNEFQLNYIDDIKLVTLEKG